jgi:hypothetical protein
MSTNAKLITDETVTLVFEGKVFTLTRESANEIGATAAIQRGNLALAAELIDRSKAVAQRSAGAFIVENGVVLHNGQPIHNVISERIVEALNENVPFEAFTNFLSNILLNTSARAVSEGYEFLEHRNLPLTEDGHFLAYKSVASDYLSKASGREPVEVSTDGGRTWTTYKGRIPNKVGSIVRMPRNLVDDNRAQECSYGLHVGSLAYSGPNGFYHSGNDKVVIVKVNPRDIVAVPKDYQAQKMRVCQYEVVADFVSAYDEPVTDATGNTFDGSSNSEPEVFCNEDLGGCNWAGDYTELDFGYECPDCGNSDTLEPTFLITAKS